MAEIVTATELRDHSAELLDGIDKGRVLITKHGKGQAFLISVTELHALDETLAVLEDEQLVKNIAQGLADMKAGRTRDASDVFTELDAEFDE